MVAAITAAALRWNPDGSAATITGSPQVFSASRLDSARQVFLAGQRLSERWQSLQNESFTLIEIGFAAGLNFLAAMALWQQTGRAGWLHYVAVQEHPLTLTDLTQVQQLWPQLAAQATALQAQYPPLVPGFHRLLFPEARISLTLLWGDMPGQLHKLEAQAQAWFFNQAETGSLDNQKLAADLERLSATAATFSSDDDRTLSQITRKLSQPLARQAAPPSKPWLQRGHQLREKGVTVIGAGIAGASAARSLAERGWQVRVVDAAPHAASGASGNPAAIIYPKLAPAAIADEHFQQQAFLLAQRRFQQLAPADVWRACGLLWFLAGNQAREGDKLQGHPWPDSLVRRVNPQEASLIAGLPLPYDALYFPTAGLLAPRRFCEVLLDHPNISLHYGQSVSGLNRQAEGWQIRCDSGHEFLSPTVLIATAYAARQLAATAQLPLKAVRGQVSTLAASRLSQTLKTVLCYGGYLSPAQAGLHCLGASFYPGREDQAVLSEENQENREGLAHYLPELAQSLPATASWRGRAALRCQSPDYLPLVGPLPDLADFEAAYAGLRQGQQRSLSTAPNLPGLYCMLGFGSKGFTTALLAAEVIAAELNQEPYPVPRAVLDALHPARLWARQLSRRQR